MSTVYVNKNVFAYISLYLFHELDMGDIIILIQKLRMCSSRIKYIVDNHLPLTLHPDGFQLAQIKIDSFISVQNPRKVIEGNCAYMVEICNYTSSGLHLEKIGHGYNLTYLLGILTLYIKYSGKIKNPKSNNNYKYDRSAKIVLEFSSDINHPYTKRTGMLKFPRPPIDLLEWRENDMVTNTVDGYRLSILQNIVNGLIYSITGSRH